MSEHIVQPGDTLSAIAHHYGVSLHELLSANPQLADPDRIQPGERIAIPKAGPHWKGWLTMSFDGKLLHIRPVVGNGSVRSFRARSGLPPGHRKIRSLMAAGREGLDTNTDYRSREYQDLEDVGPVPENRYTLHLTKGMAYEKSEAHEDPQDRAAGWGEGGWWLDEGWWDRLFSDRSGFFLHHDGAGPGTSGCIGVVDRADLRAIKAMLRTAYRRGQRKVVVTVDYPD